MSGGIAVAALAVCITVPTATASVAPVEMGPRAPVSPAGERMGEFMVAQDPSDPAHLVVAAFALDDPSAAATSVALVSRDAGITWHKSAPFATSPPFNRLNEWAAVGGDGTAYFVALEIHRPTSTEPGKDRLQLATSTDGGDHWGPPRYVPLPSATTSVDHPSIFLTRKGTVLVCGNATLALKPRPLVKFLVSRSTDGGRRWTTTAPVGYEAKAESVGLQQAAMCNGIVEAPDGTLYTDIIGNASTWTTRSTDDGRTWDTVRKLSEIDISAAKRYDVGVRNLTAVAEPSLAVNPQNGHLVSNQVELATSDGPRHLVLQRSTDRGRTWGRIRLPDVPACTGCAPVRSTAVFDAQGRLAVEVVYAPYGALSKEFWLLMSSDEGETWLRPVQFADPTGPTQSWADPRTFRPSTAALPRVADYDLRDGVEKLPPLDGVQLQTIRADQMIWGGDNWGMTTTPDGGFLLMWQDESSNGSPQLWAREVHVRMP